MNYVEFLNNVLQENRCVTPTWIVKGNLIINISYYIL